MGSKETIILDGKNNGFCIYSIPAQDYIRNKAGNILMFRNIDLARVFAANARKLFNPYDYSLYISCYDSVIDYEFFEYIDGCYQLYADGDIKYFIKPIINRNVERIGYLVFNGGEREFDKDKGISKSNTYHKAVLEVLDEMVKRPMDNPTIESIKKDKFGICAQVKFSTTKIHICYNSQIMTINQNRKLNGMRAFRFDKDMDKYTTLYCFIDIDASELGWFEGVTKAQQILNNIAAAVVNKSNAITSCEYKEIELLNPIFLEETPIKRDLNRKD